MFIPPMLLHKTDSTFNLNDPRYLFELKNNGVRLLYESHSKGFDLYSRHGTLLNGRLPELYDLEELGDCYLDGELVCFNEGFEDFEGVMARINSKSKKAINRGIVQLPVSYVIFDILRWKGKSVIHLPLVDRKEILNDIVQENKIIRKAVSYRENGDLLFSEVKKFGLEGIVCKRIDSKYHPSVRSKDWLKHINWRYYDCYIKGYKKKGMGWLLSFVDTSENAGTLEFGVGPSERKAFYQIAESLVIGESANYTYIEPVIKCKIKGRGLLKSGTIMTPVFVEFIL